MKLNLYFTSDNERDASSDKNTFAFYEKGTRTKRYIVDVFRSRNLTLRTSGPGEEEVSIAKVEGEYIRFLRPQSIAHYSQLIDEWSPAAEQINEQVARNNINRAKADKKFSVWLKFKRDPSEYRRLPTTMFPGTSRIIHVGDERYYWLKESYNRLVVSNNIFGCCGNNLTEPLQLLSQGRETHLAEIKYDKDRSGSEKSLTIFSEDVLDSCLAFAMLYFQGRIDVP